MTDEGGHDASAGNVQQSPEEAEEPNREHGVVSLIGMSCAKEHAVHGDAPERASQIPIGSMRDESALDLPGTRRQS